MGMPISIEIVDTQVTDADFSAVYGYFTRVDNKYSTYKDDSEISEINRGLPPSKWSEEMRTVLKLCEQTKLETDGFFDISRGQQMDPSGLVKGWAIQNAAQLLEGRHIVDFCIEAGGDIQPHGANAQGTPWRVGLRNPFNPDEIIKVVAVSDRGVATSGTYIRGQHIYNPHDPAHQIEDIVSITVIGPNIYEADRFATAAFAMGKKGIGFIDQMRGFEGYLIDSSRNATYTSGFEKYLVTK